MFIPAMIHVKHKKVTSGHGIFSGISVNGPSGDYKVIKIFENPSESDITSLTRGNPLARILALKPGMLALIEETNG